MSYGWHDALGNIGVATILIAYAMLQRGRLTVSDWGFSAANAIGSALILISLAIDFNLSAAIVEAAWLLISLFGLWQVWSRRLATDSSEE